MVAKLMRLDNEVLSVLCEKCTCCLASTYHCWTCHSTVPIEKLCGCGSCKARADDYVERVRMGDTRINNIRKMKGLNDH